MDEQVDHPSNTREFMAMWNTVTAEHLTHKLTGVLQDLPASGPWTATSCAVRRRLRKSSPRIVYRASISSAPAAPSRTLFPPLPKIRSL